MLRMSCLVTLAVGALVWPGATQSQIVAQGGYTQVQFAGPSGMQVRWFVQGASSTGGYPGPPLVVPARYNFKQGYTYRLKLTHIPGFPGLELYPTLEIPVTEPKAQQFLAHSSVKLELIAEDFAQVLSGKHIIKSIYLPGNGNHTAWPPLVVLRMGNLDVESPESTRKE